MPTSNRRTYMTAARMAAYREKLSQFPHGSTFLLSKFEESWEIYGSEGLFAFDLTHIGFVSQRDLVGSAGKYTVLTIYTDRELNTFISCLTSKGYCVCFASADFDADDELK